MHCGGVNSTSLSNLSSPRLIPGPGSPANSFRRLADETRLAWSHDPASGGAREALSRFADAWNEISDTALDRACVERSFALAEFTHSDNKPFVEIPDAGDAAAAVITRFLNVASIIFCARLLALPLTHDEPVRPWIFWSGVMLFFVLTAVLIVIDARNRRLAAERGRRQLTSQTVRHQKQLFETALSHCRAALGL